jgi:hypothetical protein
VPLQVARTTDFAFSPGANVLSLRCLTWSARGLFACAQESLDNWTLALSSDEGQSFAPLWHVQDLVPLECAASTATGSACPAAWLDVSAQIGADLVPDGIPNSGGTAAPAPAAAKEDSSCDLSLAPRPERRPLSQGLPWLGGVGAAVLWRRRRRSSRATS